MAKTELKEIPLSQLVIDKFNARGGEWISDEGLIDSIRKQGVLEPLLVRPVKNKFGIVCGSRRFFASREARLKTVPCIIREGLTDVNALGISLQENLQSNSLDGVQESEAIAKMWEMFGEKTYEEKMKEMEKRFGLKETTVREYLQISRLSDKIKEFLKPTAASRGKLDITTAARISGADWEDDEKEEIAEILSEVETARDRRKMLSKMKSYKDLSPAEAFEKVRKIPQGQTYYVYLDAKSVKATDKATEKEELDAETLIKDIYEKWLKKRGYLN